MWLYIASSQLVEFFTRLPLLTLRESLSFLRIPRFSADRRMARMGNKGDTMNIGIFRACGEPFPFASRDLPLRNPSGEREKGGEATVSRMCQYIAPEFELAHNPRHNSARFQYAEWNFYPRECRISLFAFRQIWRIAQFSKGWRFIGVLYD